jgi:hypothetical protein
MPFDTAVAMHPKTPSIKQEETPIRGAFKLSILAGLDCLAVYGQRAFFSKKQKYIQVFFVCAIDPSPLPP